MANEFRGAEEHSAEYFGETRDSWWNEDHLALCARRWGLAGAVDVLEVGAGVGHWSRSLAPVLATAARICGIDREARWVDEARRRASRAGLEERVRYVRGTAERLPFPEARFDVVTCQTLLIHVVRLCDRAAPLWPPYADASQRSLADELVDMAARDLGIWSKADTHRFFVAGGGDSAAFPALWARALESRRRSAGAIADNTFSTAGGSVLYLFAARKPDGKAACRP